MYLVEFELLCTSADTDFGSVSSARLSSMQAKVLTN